MTASVCVFEAAFSFVPPDWFLGEWLPCCPKRVSRDKGQFVHNNPLRPSQAPIMPQ
jgi:hypothetical protein